MGLSLQGKFNRNGIEYWLLIIRKKKDHDFFYLIFGFYIDYRVFFKLEISLLKFLECFLYENKL